MTHRPETAPLPALTDQEQAGDARQAARRALSLAVAVLAGYALRDVELRYGWLPPLLLALVAAVAWLGGCVWQGHRLTDELDRMRAERDQALAGRVLAVDGARVVPLPLTARQRAKAAHPAGRGR